MEELERLAGQVARSLNLSAETVADFAKSDEAIRGLAEAFKANRTKIDTDGYTRAEGKIKAEVEKALKGAGLESASFETLADSLTQLKASAAASSGDALTEEQAREHPVVRRLLADAENDKKQAVAQAQKEAESGLKKDREAFYKEQEDAKLKVEFRQQIKDLDPNLNPDPEKAEKQIERMVKELLAAPRKKEADGSFLPVDANGVYLDNGSGGSKSLKEFVRDVVTVDFGFDLPVGERAREMPAAGRTSTSSGYEHYKGPAPKNETEYLAIANDQSLPLAARQEVTKAWEARGQ